MIVLAIPLLISVFVGAKRFFRSAPRQRRP
jgi:hypothetical protein